MKVEGEVGPDVAADGSVVAIRLGRTGEQVVSELMPRYYLQALRANSYMACNAAAQAVSVGLATTYTGLCLSNPLGSGKNLVLKTASYALSVAPAAIAPIFLIGGYSATQVVHTTPLASPGIQGALLTSSTASVAKVDTSATIPTPGYLMPLFGGFTAAALPSPPNVVVPIEGQIVIPPNGFVAIGALTAITGFGGFTWDEVPV